ncbi:MAG: hypothetical protein IBJ10_02330 [Phycisphaerales bacterium]|nr:hypothetical protein [Phycisphaerales bacterium]
MNPRFIHTALLISALVSSAGAHAQSAPQAPPTAPAASPAGAGAVALHPEPFDFPGLGLTISLPDRALVETTTAGRTESFNVRPPDNAWMLSFEERRSRDFNLTPAAIADELIAGFQASRVKGVPSRNPRGSQPQIDRAQTEVRVLDRQPSLILGGVPASRFYLTVPEDESNLIHAYTVFMAEPGRFVIARMQCLEPELPRARLLYEAVMASAKFKDPIEAATERAAAILAGEGLMRGLSQEDLDGALLPEPEWRRLFRPASTGSPKDAQEVAYQKIEIRRGARGDLTPERPPARWTATEKQPGYLVRVVGRYLDGGRLIDSESVFFATLGLSENDEEAWTVRLRIREGAKEAAWTETGARFGRRLSVRVQADGASPTETTWTIPDKGYISQVESFMLPRLLARSRTPLVFAFYCYNSTTGKIELRRDVMESADDGANWLIRTRLTESMAERETLLTAEGGLISTTTADGVVMEPTELDRLHALWKSKGLPTAN